MNSRRQSGDTIVEVLLVLTILSLSFAISYAAANAGLRKSRNAEEHSQALGIISSQIELVRTAVAQKAVDPFPTHNAFCMKDASDVAQIQSFTQAIPATAGQDDFSGYPAACVVNGLYRVAVTYHTFADDSRNYFEFLVRWPGAGTLGPQQESMSYKMPILVGAGAVYTDPPTPSPVLTPIVTLNNTPAGPGVMRLSWSVASPDPAVTTQCQYDGGAWFDCSSPHNQTYTASGPGLHTFVVKATNKFGSGSSSASWSTGFNATFYGNQFYRCDQNPSDSIPWDGNDGCKTTGSSEYSRRNISAYYLVNDASILAGPAHFTMNYSQFAGAGTVPPYSAYEVYATVLDAGGNQVDRRQVPAPIEAYSGASWSARNSSVIDVNVPNGPFSIRIDWVNNAGFDPDLQINSLRVYR